MLIRELADVIERAGVVDEDVDRAQLCDGTLHGGGDLVAIGDVTAHRDRPSPHLADLLGGRLGADEPLGARNRCERPVGVRLLGQLRLDEQVGDHDVGTCSRERQGVRAAEPARAAGDKCDASREVDLDGHDGTYPRGRKISFAITRRWIWEVPS